MNPTFYILLFSAYEDKNRKNPLSEPFDTPHEVPPFDRIQLKDYLPAFEQAITEACKDIRKITENTEQASFENTIATLDQAGEQLNIISSVFFNLNSACTNEEMQKIAQQISPRLTEYSNSIYMNPQLFKG